MYLHFLVSRQGARPTADDVCAWDAPASELGLDTGAAPAEPAEPAAGGAADDSPDDRGDASQATRTGAERAETEGRDDEQPDDDQDPDALDLLTEREDEDHPDRPARSLEDRFKSLRQRSRQLEKSLKKNLPVIQALRESGMDLRTLLQRHDSLARLEAAMERNPRLRALLNGEDDNEPPARGSRTREAEDEVTYPFDTTDEVGRFMAQFHQDVRNDRTALNERLDKIEKLLGGRLDRIEHTSMSERVRATEQTWKGAVDAAAAKLDKGYRKMFGDAMYGVLQQVIAGKLRLTPQQAIDHYLKELRISDKTKQVASAAARQRTAQRNDQLPRRPSGGAGTPASPRSGPVPRMADFNRSIMRRYGAA